MKLIVKSTDDYKVYAEWARGVDGSECLSILTSDLKRPDELHVKLQLFLSQAERLRLADFLLKNTSRI